MKKLVTFFLANAMGMLLAYSVQAQDTAPKTPQAAPVSEAAATTAAQLSFKETEHDFGDIKEGETVEYTFRFENTGKTPLVIANVRTTCGCTATKWPREPIAPGEKGEITARFDSTGKSGPQTKIITIFSNGINPQERVTLKTNVVNQE